ncbi:hypothetical protein HK100_000792 [Physocladia obscura]|uniref:GATA-type domain-containing protein n=1 Tax=Physocladia obscura TaxID=109957 RepID=A0AAD5XHH1_9FUNG|nr:hypothetical protein HK100_000792 [Physocladia obscura]
MTRTVLNDMDSSYFDLAVFGFGGMMNLHSPAVSAVTPPPDERDNDNDDMMVFLEFENHPNDNDKDNENDKPTLIRENSFIVIPSDADSKPRPVIVVNNNAPLASPPLMLDSEFLLGLGPVLPKDHTVACDFELGPSAAGALAKHFDGSDNHLTDDDDDTQSPRLIVGSNDSVAFIGEPQLLLLPTTTATTRGQKESRRASRNLVCFDCGTTTTPLWRRSENKLNIVCNACGKYLSCSSSFVSTKVPKEPAVGNADETNESDDTVFVVKIQSSRWQQRHTTKATTAVDLTPQQKLEQNQKQEQQQHQHRQPQKQKIEEQFHQEHVATPTNPVAVEQDDSKTTEFYDVSSNFISIPDTFTTGAGDAATAATSDIATAVELSAGPGCYTLMAVDECANVNVVDEDDEDMGWADLLNIM